MPDDLTEPNRPTAFGSLVTLDPARKGCIRAEEGSNGPLGANTLLASQLSPYL